MAPQPNDRPTVNGKRFVIGALAAIVVLAISTSLYVRANGAALKESFARHTAKQSVTRQAVFHIEGMHCDGCATSVQETLAAAPGIMQASASFDRKEVTVVYNDQAITSERIVSTIEELGYKATLVPTAQ